MRKLFVSVAASVPMIALVLGGQPATGPDAETAALVTSACGGCHSLDQVKSKMADKAAWTETVTRMQGMGAALTAAQIPIVSDFLARAANSLVVPAPAGGKGGPDGPGGGKGGPGGAKGGIGGGAGGGKGGGKGGKQDPFGVAGAGQVSAANLKILTRENVEITMQNITIALGVTCNYCHNVADLSDDSNPKKVKARAMLEMTREINAKLGEGKTHVTCWTCHRGSKLPETSRPVPPPAPVAPPKLP